MQALRSPEDIAVINASLAVTEMLVSATGAVEVQSDGVTSITIGVGCLIPISTMIFFHRNLIAQPQRPSFRKPQLAAKKSLNRRLTVSPLRWTDLLANELIKTSYLPL